MASLRMIKKDIDCLVEQVLGDCYLTIYFHPQQEDKVVSVMKEAVDMRNSLFQRVNSPAEKNNRRLVKRHYAQVRRDMLESVDKLFSDLSAICKVN